MLKTFCTLVIGALIAISAWAQESEESLKKLDDVTAFKSRMKKMADTTNTIKAQFEQQKFMSILENEIQSSGQVLFKKPNLLKWDYRKPFIYTIVLDGKEIKIKDEQKVNTFEIESSKVFKQINDLIISSVNGQILDEEKFDIAYFHNDAQYVAHLKPVEEQMKKFIQKIEISFQKSSLIVQNIKLLEPNEDYTLITFKNQVLNEPIPNQAFHFD